ncbi:elongation factor-2 kinase [Aureococcus anophagefferens]|nr:elongation factor-2 kinase [Aureococcus anophagefferens]
MAARSGDQDHRSRTLSGEDVMRARVRELWKRGARMAREQLFEADPLAHLDLHERPEETVLRLRWVGGAWVEDVARLKVAPAPFAEGSMRMCYHAKKMSSLATVRHAAPGPSTPWRYQRNYVLKTYKPGKARGGGDRLRTMLEVDAQMQAESKALAARYNAGLRRLFDAGEFDRRAPQPMKLKCVDMLEASLVVFKDRPGRPCYFMEAYVEGDFVKHNGNAGYVNDRDHVARATPQAFSHFTFCETGGARLVHTRDGAGFGVGNGGPRGIALFFATHRCNRICGAMGLARFKRQGDGLFCGGAPRGAEAAHAAALGRLEAALDGEVFDDAGAAAGDAGPAVR